jgi:ubiquinone/menaquinone biosynthesis C-methylase UbiE
MAAFQYALPHGVQLICPDCRHRLDRDLSCTLCGRSFVPDRDGIIDGTARSANEIVLREAAFHDEQATYYDEMYCDPEPIHSYVRHLVRRHLYPHYAGAPFVVDLCCGTGKGSLPLLELGVPVVGIDISLEMLRAYARKAKDRNLLLIRADASNPPLAPQSCSAIQMIGGLHHIPNREACVRNCCAALAPGGAYIVHEPIQTWTRGPHPMLRPLQNLDAITNPARVFRAILRRLHMRRPSPPAADERLYVTPDERPFTSAEELTAMLPPGMRIAEIQSRMQVTDWPFGPHLQPFKAAASAVVMLDDWLSHRERRWRGHAICGVFQRA